MEKFKTAVTACCAAVGFFSASLLWAETGVMNNQIAVGMSTVLSGPSSHLGTNFKTGVETYLNMVNEKGGVYGRKIKLTVYDDGYEPANTIMNVNKLIKEDKVFCLLGDVGTPTTMAIKPTLTDEKVPLFAPFTGAEGLRNPVDRYILNYRASYNQEVEVFVRGAVDVLGFKKIAVFYQDDSYGTAVLNAAKSSLKKRALSPVATGTYVRNFEEVSRALNVIMGARPQAVIMAGTYSACAKFITAWKRQYYLGGKQKGLDPVFMNVSFVGPDRLAELLDKYADNVVVTQVVPPLFAQGDNYSAVTEYLALLKKYFPNQKPSFGGLEGFLATEVFVEGLKRAGKNLTRESFITAVEGIKDFDIRAGNTIGFSAENHQGSQTVYPTVIKNGTFYLINDWHTVKQE